MAPSRPPPGRLRMRWLSETSPWSGSARAAGRGGAGTASALPPLQQPRGRSPALAPALPTQPAAPPVPPLAEGWAAAGAVAARGSRSRWGRRGPGWGAVVVPVLPMTPSAPPATQATVAPPGQASPPPGVTAPCGWTRRCPCGACWSPRRRRRRCRRCP
ncbi:MAG: hypothetical protein J3K34DRAFT_430357 [Monoraphidium minutum]|nr:MAG: hypothetical protein J3K34DRAFT_430357 [Monoraphidium minutum]